MKKLILKFLGKVLTISETNIESVINWYFKKRNKMRKGVTVVKSSGIPEVEGAVQLGSNTQINFTLKTFIAFIAAILGLFVGFYQLVIVPRVNKAEEHYQTMYNDQKEQNRIFYEKLGNINTSIGSLNATVEEFNRLYNNHQESINNSGGSLGGNNSGNK